MDNAQARALVHETFTHAFDKVNYQRFLREIVNRFDESKASAWGHQYIKDAFKPHVERYERLGTYTSPDRETVDLLVVYLTQETKLHRGRTALRNFVAHHLKQRDEKDAALVAFISPSEHTWRFSFVKMEYATERDDRGVVSVSETLTPARRFSYLVGEGESCHTAQTRFLGLLQDTANDPTLAQIADAFSVETVTKEFFAQYHKLFEDINAGLEELLVKDKALRNELEKNAFATVDLAKKLLGQIVFLYFIQKKGWLGVPKGQEWGSGPKDFLRRLANKEYGQYRNFFNDVLEPLFYDTLATDRGHQAWCSHFNCRIPFLNGGLFEPLGDYDWKKIDINLPNELFTNHERTESNDPGTGVLDVFDRYNFTVNEAEPLEQEVAIDPEMLGKVFENLIEENRRKGLGAYYTPREIVHYMCQEALIQYLYRAVNPLDEAVVRPSPVQDGLFAGAEPAQAVFTVPATKEKISRDDLDVLIHTGEQAAHFEAARKSGTVSYRAQLPATIEENARLIDEKLRDITVCDPAIGSGAFPVGMMTEIVRVRMTLTPYFNDVRQRTAYYFKRHAIQNCLYGVDIDRGAVEIAKLRLWLSLVVDEEETTQVKPLPNLLYKIVAGNSLLGIERTLFNQSLFQQVETLKLLYFDEVDTTKKAALKRQIDELILRLTDGKETFDFKIYFSEVFHKNGGFDVVVANPPYGLLNKRQNRHESIIVSERELEYFKTALEYAPARGGMINVFRLFIVRSVKILRPGGCFSEIFPLAFACDASAAGLREHLLNNHEIIRIEAFPERDNEKKRVFEAVKMSVCIVILVADKKSDRPFTLRIHGDRYVDTRNEAVDLNLQTVKTIDQAKYSIPLLRKSELAIVESVYRLALPLARFGHCYTGEIDLTQDKGYLTDDKRQAVLIKGAIVDRYQIRSRMSQGEIVFLKAQEYLAENHGKRANHYHTRRIVMQGITGVNEKIRLKMTLAEAGLFCANSVNYIVLSNSAVEPEYLLGLLNSSLLNFVFAKTSTNSNVNGYEVDNLPIRIVDGRAREKIVALVNRILAAKSRDGGVNTSALERDIDRLVCQVYGLTENDIAVVEADTSPAMLGD